MEARTYIDMKRRQREASRKAEDEERRLRRESTELMRRFLLYLASDKALN